MFAPSLPNMFHDLIQKIIINNFLSYKREKDDARERNVKTLGLTYLNFASLFSQGYSLLLSERIFVYRYFFVSGNIFWNIPRSLFQKL